MQQNDGETAAVRKFIFFIFFKDGQDKKRLLKLDIKMLLIMMGMLIVLILKEMKM